MHIIVTNPTRPSNKAVSTFCRLGVRRLPVCAAGPRLPFDDAPLPLALAPVDVYAFLS